MIKVGIFGATGRVGRLLIDLVKQSDKCELGAIFVRGSLELDLPKNCLVTNDLERFIQASDVIIDFSLPQATRSLLEALEKFPKPLVSGTTGLDEETFSKINKLSIKTPILYATNMSRGVAILNKAIAMVARSFLDSDIEICEIHHRNKKDAPSGTALTLAQTCADARGLNLQEALIGDRSKTIGARGQDEIAVVSLRGGDVAGRHTVGFYADGEYLEFLHNATSRLTFAKGALDAALWLRDKQSGLYTIQDLFDF
ncbi:MULTISPECIES: 4-hydroxy-tetrahydrodipicolinate reductase [unclassified Helicobacter]|uniref:4-hydroxy-tetrahydrodipicolinate reductase n=1 Tax=unclassified Helicobacter TaxID=2593540 RepID=UPI000CF1B071|nr:MULTISPECIES: 4-hydroxy-tetrahydrodipicolinate reductase [unclassified Helicobacter]